MTRTYSLHIASVRRALGNTSNLKGTTAIPRSMLLAVIAVFCAGIGNATLASAAVVETDKLRVSGDFRLRLEQDFDSKDSAGINRDDRLRARVRARLGINYVIADGVEFGGRIRSGSDTSQQSPHITVIDVEGGDTGDTNFNLDKWFLKSTVGGFWGWIGRNSLPMWKPNEFFWDDDVTPIGLAAGYSVEFASGSELALAVGEFSLPAGMQDACGKLTHGQIVLNSKISEVNLVVAAGLHNFEKGNPGDSDCGVYLQYNSERDYSIRTANLKLSRKLGDKPFAVGVDVMRNTENYALTDPGISAANQDQKDGWDVYLNYGSTVVKGDWFFGYWYAEIEQLAVNNSFSQDDWMRWGSATQTRSSNFEGHELRAAVGLGAGLNLVMRLYLVDSIESIEDGSRFRVDMNYKF